MKKKIFKQTASFLAAAALCASMSITSFAAPPKTTESSARAELGEYRTVISEKRETLGNLITENQKLSSQITVLQHTLKESGLLSEEDNQKLASMSEAIQATRQSITELREKTDELKSSGQESSSAGDYDSTKTSLAQVIDAQDKQISLRQTLEKQLEEKLDFLTSFEAALPETVKSTQSAK